MLEANTNLQRADSFLEQHKLWRTLW